MVAYPRRRPGPGDDPGGGRAARQTKQPLGTVAGHAGGGCADVCPELCLELVSLERLDGGDDLQRVLDERVPGDEDSVFSAIVKDETKCIRCGLCAEGCPVGAVKMERVNFVSTWRPDAIPISTG